MMRSLLASVLAFTCAISTPAASFAASSKPIKVTQHRTSTRIIPSKAVQLTPLERAIGIVNIHNVLPVFKDINQQKNIFSPDAFQYYIENFHYPYRQRFYLDKTPPPAHVVLHWTANKHTHVPLYTLSAFMRSFRGGRLRERQNKYKNVSNYFLTGNLSNQGQSEAYLIKLTRGNVKTWGDIPRVTAYPTDDHWDDNKYDGRGALGVEIESPNFSSFYYNPQQREKIHNFILMVLKERGVLEEFKDLKYSRYWSQMQSLSNYLESNLSKIDVNNRGGIPLKYQHLDKIIKDFNYDSGFYPEIQKMFNYVSGHGIVAREYNERMHKSGRSKDARYHKIDFTEPQVFLVCMDILNSDLQFKGVDAYVGYDENTQRFIRQQLNARGLSEADKGRLEDMRR